MKLMLLFTSETSCFDNQNLLSKTTSETSYFDNQNVLSNVYVDTDENGVVNYKGVTYQFFIELYDQAYIHIIDMKRDIYGIWKDNRLHIINKNSINNLDHLMLSLSLK